MSRDLNRICSDCPSSIADANKTGRCQPCAARNTAKQPGVGAKKAATYARYIADPANYAAHRARTSIAARTRWADPEYAARMGRVMREQVQPKSLLGDQSYRSDAARRANEAKLAWCPAEYRSDYRLMTKTYKISAREARATIEGQIKARLAKLSPFERQERALLNGAGMVANERLYRDFR